MTAVWVPDAAHEAMRDLILARAAAVHVLGKTRQHLQDFFEALALTPLMTLFVIVAIYIVLGFFIETLVLMVVTIPVIVTVVVELGYGPAWYGILMIVLIEMALITPPVGLNLYVVQGAGKSGSMAEVMVGALPFHVMMLLMAFALIAFPQIALWLPETLSP